MWYFKTPEVVYGEDALTHLERLEGRRALIVTDRTIVELGLADRIREGLEKAGMEVLVFDEVEPDPSVGTVKKGAALALDYRPDWIVGLGGGSAMDAAKAIRILYERPDLEPGEINPVDILGLTGKARLATIPTTSGTGAEVGWACVITDPEEQRKLIVGTRESWPDVAIVDPSLPAGMPPWLTADTGLDALVHAVEVYSGSWHNEFVDGPALVAIRLVFQYLPQAYDDGNDVEAREKMHIAATLAGLGLSNANVGLAHAMAHSLGGFFHPSHGRTAGLLLPYTIEFVMQQETGRYADIARFIGLQGEGEAELTRELVARIRHLLQHLHHPLSLEALGIPRAAFEEKLGGLVSNAESDVTLFTCPRYPSSDELKRLFEYAYDGKAVDF